MDVSSARFLVFIDNLAAFDYIDRSFNEDLGAGYTNIRFNLV